MTETATAKFNLPKTTTYIIMPLAFTGKDKRFKDLTNAYRFLLAEIYTANKAVKAPAKLTYEHFVQKFAMSRETVCAGLRKLEELKIIERLGNSRYNVLIKFNKKNYIIIDDYLSKKLWTVNGKEKRLAYSRIITLAFLHRENSNPKTSGIFTSSQARIGVALNLPKSTAGDCVRELSAIGVINLKPAAAHYSEAYKRGLTLFTVHPEILAVKRCKPEPPPDELQAVKEIFKQHSKKAEKAKSLLNEFQAAIERADIYDEADTYDKRLKQDDGYKAIKNEFDGAFSDFLMSLRSRDAGWQERSERELHEVRTRFKAYLAAQNVPPDIIRVLVKGA